MRTVFLDPSSWDLVLDQSGNIAVASDPYSQAQDAASAIRTFQGECYYNTALGIPYWQKVLGKFPPPALMQEYFVKAALAVPGVVKARCYLLGQKGRSVRGQVQIVNENGAPSFLGF